VNGVFGVGPFEMLVIAVLALIFIGPERLPKVIGDVMRTIRELRQYASGIQDEFRDDFREMRAEMETFQRDVSQSVEEMSREVDEVSRDVSQLANDVNQAANQSGTTPAEPVNELMAPPPPREGSTPLPTPNGVHSNGSSHESDEDAPVFKDYRPG
jgi:sec-independent protein translocase protein TatB